MPRTVAKGIAVRFPLPPHGFSTLRCGEAAVAAFRHSLLLVVSSRHRVALCPERLAMAENSGPLGCVRKEPFIST